MNYIQVWNISGMILTEGCRSKPSETCPSVTLSTRNPHGLAEMKPMPRRLKYDD
jgi:hypothetical protein